MRKYVHGDSPRKIIWKIFARTRDVLVRIPETARSPYIKVGGFLGVSESDGPTAGLSYLYINNNFNSREWIFGSSIKDAIYKQKDKAIEALIESGNLKKL